MDASRRAAEAAGDSCDDAQLTASDHALFDALRPLDVFSDDDASEVAVKIVARMRRNGGDAEVQASACTILSALAVRSARGRSAVSAAGGVGALVGAMLAHPAAVRVQRFGCSALSHLVSDRAECARAAVAAGAMRAVCAALEAHRTNASVQAAGSVALNNMMARSADVASEAIAAGLCASLAAAMRAHPRNAGVQGAALAALHATLASVQACATACDAGGVETTIAAMRAHAGDTGVQNFGCRTLAALHRHTDVARSSRVATRLRDTTQAVCDALATHPADASVQMSGCMAIATITARADANVAFGRAGAVALVVAALRAHRGVAVVQARGCDALQTLCNGVAAHAEQANAAGVVDDIAAAMAAHCGEQMVQMCGVSALKHIALFAARNTAGAVTAIVAAVQAASELAGVQNAACGALYQLFSRGNAKAAEHMRIARTAGAIEAVMCAFDDAHAQDGVPLYNLPCAVLDLLILGDAAHALRALRAGALECVTAHAELAVGEQNAALHRRLLQTLQAAAAAHDAGACVHGGCTRCAAARARGAMCAAASCCARKRADGSGKALLRCGRCRAAAYCGPAHQREDWAAHKDGCAALAAAAAAGADSAAAE
jgi:hypothetical protein